MKARRRSSWRAVIPGAGQRPAFILTTVAAGRTRRRQRSMRWLASRKSLRWVSAGWISTAIFRRLRSKKRRLALSWRWPRSCRCRYFCTAAMRTSASWPCCCPGLISSRGPLCIVLPVAAKRCANAWSTVYLLASPAGYAMSVGGWSCESCWSIFRQSAC
ncbi:Uncharacterised protein [Klebsiella pneumoniae]|nr:Uncharacterised protein [Klebsiella pneumoniae]